MLSPAPRRPQIETHADALSRLVRLLQFGTDVFHAGGFCGQAVYERVDVPAQFHFVLEGSLLVRDLARGTELRIDAPGLIAFPVPSPHQIASGIDGCHLLCCYVQPNDAVSAALIRALPQPMRLDLRVHSRLRGLAQLLQMEISEVKPGHDEALNLYLRSVVMEAVRVALAEGGVPPGLLSVITEPRLARAIAAFLERPGGRWTIASLARTAGMSRSAFAATFARVAAMTPQQFLSAVRHDLGARLLAQGVPAKAVARTVGYASASSLARSIRQAGRHGESSTPTADP
jgi:AraC-like DNA-binding protein